MGVYIRENNFKFDKVDRTYKKETANAVANSIYHIKDTQKISEALGYFLDIYRIDGKKSYEGTKKQFSSHYIPAIELGVIKSSSPYVLSDLAIKMVEAEINPKEYLSIVLLNYFQIIDEKPINLLYQILLLIEKYGNALLLEDIIKEKYFQDKEHTRIAIKILGDSYFFKIEDDKLIFNKSNFSLNELLKITKSEEDNANTYPIDYFKSQQNFSDFLTKFKKPIEFPTLKLEINKNVNKKINKNMPYQKIVYGAPGTGKSYKLKHEIDKNFKDIEEIVPVSKRVTFYDGYTYGQFVGSYKPVMYETENNSKEIGYEFISGPLLNQILNAYKYPND
ncbi:MAG: hypothetical protein ACRC0Y_07200, partial [Fusobacteriaceae bacterium]